MIVDATRATLINVIELTDRYLIVKDDPGKNWGEKFTARLALDVELFNAEEFLNSTSLSQHKLGRHRAYATARAIKDRR